MIAVLGDGAWGTAIALMLFEKGSDVRIWSNFPEYADILRDKRENVKFLPGIKIPEDIPIMCDINEAVSGADLIVLAVPSRYARSVCRKLASAAPRCFLSVSKGIEPVTMKRGSEIVREEVGDVPFAVLSGPSHAEEVSRRIPTAVVCASYDIKTAEYVQGIFAGERFRVYTADDVTGVELCGALKNVIAIAVGICDGMRLGDNPKAAVMTRGLAEAARLGAAMGAKRETFAGLAGMGDIIVTCISRFGRNLRFGRMIAGGKSPEEALSSTEMVVEGVTTASAAHKLSIDYKIDMPISNEVYKVIYEKKPYKDAVRDLMMRAPKREMEW